MGTERRTSAALRTHCDTGLVPLTMGNYPVAYAIA